MLKITEVFPSIQGEGLRLGEPTIFIRLAGCNLSCDFCDTKYARRGGKDFTIEAILGSIEIARRNFPCSWICLTGGEPHLQDVTGFIRALQAEGYRVQVETNGTLKRPLIADWYTVSPKPPGYRIAPGLRTKAREVKLVVTRGLSLSRIRSVRRAFPSRTPVLLQPQSNLGWSVRRAWDLLEKGLAAGLPNLRLSIQAHKILRLP